MYTFSGSVCVCACVCSKGNNLKLINWLSFIAKTTLSNESLYLYLVVYSTVCCLVAAAAAADAVSTAAAIQPMLTHSCIHIRTQLCATTGCKPVLNPLNLCALEAINSSKLGPMHRNSRAATHRKQIRFSIEKTQSIAFTEMLRLNDLKVKSKTSKISRKKRKKSVHTLALKTELDRMCKALKSIEWK